MISWVAVLLATAPSEADAPLRVMRWIPCARPSARPPTVVVPYVVNLYGWDALRTYEGTAHYPQVLADVREYLEWYLARRQRPDRFGLVGTVDDHRIGMDGRAEPTGRYDSADAYAATFLLLADAYVEASGDTTWFVRHAADLREVAYLIATLVDPADGLTRAMPGGAKYLMDNVEAYAGLVRFARRLERWDPEDAAYYASFAQALRAAIERELYDPRTGWYAWAKDEAGRHLARPDRFYPDTYAQLFPALAGLRPVPVPPTALPAALPCEQARVVGWWRSGWRWVDPPG